MGMDGWIRIGTKIDTQGLEEGITKIKGVLSKVAKNLGGVVLGLIAGAVATGLFILNKAVEKANGETGQLKANLSYIGFVGSKIFENLLSPAIDKTTGFVNNLATALYRVIVYLGYILSQWTGRNLFEGTSVEDYAEAMEKANKSASGTAKSTAKIKKDLMSFDEVNKLSDNNSGSGGGSGITLPNLPKVEDVPIPAWVEWIAKHGKLVADILEAIALGLVAIKLGLKPLQAIGLVVVIKSIKKLIGDIKDYIKEPTWDKFGEILKDISYTLLGISLLIGPTTPIGQFALVVAGIVWVIGDLKQVLGEVKELIEKPSWQKFSDVFDTLTSRMGLVGMALKKLKEPIIDFLKTAQDKLGQVKDIIDNKVIAPIQSKISTIKNLINIGLQWLVNRFEAKFGEIPAVIIKVINAMITKINNGMKIAIPPLLQKAVGMSSWSPNISPIKLAQGGIINRPGRGVALGNNLIGGEGGREAVLPLTDEVFDKIGEAIARHQVINATIVNEMNGRVLSRELKQIMNENNFANNG